MTTHDMQPEMVDPAVRADRSAEQPAEMQPAERQPADRRSADGRSADGQSTEAPLETVDATRDLEAPVEPSAPADAAPATAHDTEQALFDEGALTDMRSRWTDVQSAFVDDPRDCVQKADGLVADVVDRLTAGFSQARSGLEEQWSRGEEVSTEDLRIALKRYREFFERLLAV